MFNEADAMKGSHTTHGNRQFCNMCNRAAAFGDIIDHQVQLDRFYFLIEFYDEYEGSNPDDSFALDEPGHSTILE